MSDASRRKGSGRPSARSGRREERSRASTIPAQAQSRDKDTLLAELRDEAKKQFEAYRIERIKLGNDHPAVKAKKMESQMRREEAVQQAQASFSSLDLEQELQELLHVCQAVQNKRALHVPKNPLASDWHRARGIVDPGGFDEPAEDSKESQSRSGSARQAPQASQASQGGPVGPDIPSVRHFRQYVRAKLDQVCVAPSPPPVANSIQWMLNDVQRAIEAGPLSQRVFHRLRAFFTESVSHLDLLMYQMSCRWRRFCSDTRVAEPVGARYANALNSLIATSEHMCVRRDVIDSAWQRLGSATKLSAEAAAEAATRGRESTSEGVRGVAVAPAESQAMNDFERECEHVVTPSDIAAFLQWTMPFDQACQRVRRFRLKLKWMHVSHCRRLKSLFLAVLNAHCRGADVTVAQMQKPHLLSEDATLVADEASVRAEEAQDLLSASALAEVDAFCAPPTIALDPVEIDSHISNICQSFEALDWCRRYLSGATHETGVINAVKAAVEQRKEAAAEHVESQTNVHAKGKESQESLLDTDPLWDVVQRMWRFFPQLFFYQSDLLDIAPARKTHDQTIPQAVRPADEKFPERSLVHDDAMLDNSDVRPIRSAVDKSASLAENALESGSDLGSDGEDNDARDVESEREVKDSSDADQVPWSFKWKDDQEAAAVHWTRSRTCHVIFKQKSSWAYRLSNHMVGPEAEDRLRQAEHSPLAPRLVPAVEEQRAFLWSIRCVDPWLLEIHALCTAQKLDFIEDAVQSEARDHLTYIKNFFDPLSGPLHSSVDTPAPTQPSAATPLGGLPPPKTTSDQSVPLWKAKLLAQLRVLRVRHLRICILKHLNYFRSLERTLHVDYRATQQTHKMRQNSLFSKFHQSKEESLPNATASARADTVRVGGYGEIAVEDAEGHEIIYEAALDDLTLLEEELLRLGTHFVNMYIVDVGVNVDSGRGGVEVGVMKVDRWQVVLDLFESELSYQRAKFSWIQVLHQAYEHCFDPKRHRELAQELMDAMGERPLFDLMVRESGSESATPTSSDTLRPYTPMSLPAEYFAAQYKARVGVLQSRTAFLSSVIEYQMQQELHHCGNAGDWRSHLLVPDPNTRVPVQLTATNPSPAHMMQSDLLQFFQSLSCVADMRRDALRVVSLAETDVLRTGMYVQHADSRIVEQAARSVGQAPGVGNAGVRAQAHARHVAPFMELERNALEEAVWRLCAHEWQSHIEEVKAFPCAVSPLVHTLNAAPPFTVAQLLSHVPNAVLMQLRASHVAEDVANVEENEEKLRRALALNTYEVNTVREELLDAVYEDCIVSNVYSFQADRVRAVNPAGMPSMPETSTVTCLALRELDHLLGSSTVEHFRDPVKLVSNYKDSLVILRMALSSQVCRVLMTGAAVSFHSKLMGLPHIPAEAIAFGSMPMPSHKTRSSAEPTGEAQGTSSVEYVDNLLALQCQRVRIERAVCDLRFVDPLSQSPVAATGNLTSEYFLNLQDIRLLCLDTAIRFAEDMVAAFARPASKHDAAASSVPGVSMLGSASTADHSALGREAGDGRKREAQIAVEKFCKECIHALAPELYVMDSLSAADRWARLSHFCPLLPLSHGVSVGVDPINVVQHLLADQSGLDVSPPNAPLDRPDTHHLRKATLRSPAWGAGMSQSNQQRPKERSDADPSRDMGIYAAANRAITKKAQVPLVQHVAAAPPVTNGVAPASNPLPFELRSVFTVAKTNDTFVAGLFSVPSPLPLFRLLGLSRFVVDTKAMQLEMVGRSLLWNIAEFAEALGRMELLDVASNVESTSPPAPPIALYHLDRSGSKLRHASHVIGAASHMLKKSGMKPFSPAKSQPLRTNARADASRARGGIREGISAGSSQKTVPLGVLERQLNKRVSLMLEQCKADSLGLSTAEQVLELLHSRRLVLWRQLVAVLHLRTEACVARGDAKGLHTAWLLRQLVSAGEATTGGIDLGSRMPLGPHMSVFAPPLRTVRRADQPFSALLSSLTEDGHVYPTYPISPGPLSGAVGSLFCPHACGVSAVTRADVTLGLAPFQTGLTQVPQVCRALSITVSAMRFRLSKTATIGLSSRSLILVGGSHVPTGDAVTTLHSVARDANHVAQLVMGVGGEYHRTMRLKTSDGIVVEAEPIPGIIDRFSYGVHGGSHPILRTERLVAQHLTTALSCANLAMSVFGLWRDQLPVMLLHDRFHAIQNRLRSLGRDLEHKLDDERLSMAAEEQRVLQSERDELRRLLAETPMRLDTRPPALCFSDLPKNVFQLDVLHVAQALASDFACDNVFASLSDAAAPFVTRRSYLSSFKIMEAEGYLGRVNILRAVGMAHKQSPLTLYEHVSDQSQARSFITPAASHGRSAAELSTSSRSSAPHLSVGDMASSRKNTVLLLDFCLRLSLRDQHILAAVSRDLMARLFYLEALQYCKKLLMSIYSEAKDQEQRLQQTRSDLNETRSLSPADYYSALKRVSSAPDSHSDGRSKQSSVAEAVGQYVAELSNDRVQLSHVRAMQHNMVDRRFFVIPWLRFDSLLNDMVRGAMPWARHHNRRRVQLVQDINSHYDAMLSRYSAVLKHVQSKTDEYNEHWTSHIHEQLVDERYTLLLEVQGIRERLTELQRHLWVTPGEERSKAERRYTSQSQQASMALIKVQEQLQSFETKLKQSVEQYVLSLKTATLHEMVSLGNAPPHIKRRALEDIDEEKMALLEAQQKATVREMLSRMQTLFKIRNMIVHADYGQELQELESKAQIGRELREEVQRMSEREAHLLQQVTESRSMLSQLRLEAKELSQELDIAREENKRLQKARADKMAAMGLLESKALKFEVLNNMDAQKLQFSVHSITAELQRLRSHQARGDERRALQSDMFQRRAQLLRTRIAEEEKLIRAARQEAKRLHRRTPKTSLPRTETGLRKQQETLISRIDRLHAKEAHLLKERTRLEGLLRPSSPV